MMIDREVMRAKLLALKAELLHEDEISAADRAPLQFDQTSIGRLSRMDAMQMQAMAVALQQRRRVERDQIDAALQRLESGEYGYCVICGEEIPPARLLHTPAAPTCIKCTRK